MGKITVIEQELNKLIIKFENEEKVNVKYYTKAFEKILYALGILTEGAWNNDKLAYSLDSAKDKAFKYIDILSEDKFDFETISDEDFDGGDIEEYDDNRIVRETKNSVLLKPNTKVEVVEKVEEIKIVEKKTHKKVKKIPKKKEKVFVDIDYINKKSIIREKFKKN